MTTCLVGKPRSGAAERRCKLLDIPTERTVTVNEDSEWLRQNPQQEQEWLRQVSLIYTGLILLGVYMVQPFLTAASLDLSAKLCVVAFSVAIPLLAALVLINQQEAFRRRATKSVLAVIARVVAQDCAFVGLVAGFWHIYWIAGVGVLASGLVAVGVHSAGFWRLEQDQKSRPKEGEEPGDTES
jgi:hypothetical protein